MVEIFEKVTCNQYNLQPGWRKALEGTEPSFPQTPSGTNCMRPSYNFCLIKSK